MKLETYVVVTEKFFLFVLFFLEEGWDWYNVFKDKENYLEV